MYGSHIKVIYLSGASFLTWIASGDSTFQLVTSWPLLWSSSSKCITPAWWLQWLTRNMQTQQQRNMLSLDSLMNHLEGQSWSAEKETNRLTFAKNTFLDIFSLGMDQTSFNLLKKAFATWQHAFLFTRFEFFLFCLSLSPFLIFLL